MTWFDICSLHDLTPERGVSALVDGRQVAVFRLTNDELFAVGNRDPFSGANVICRGIIGTRDDAPKVASPMYKQTFDLRSGRCFEDDSIALPTFPVRVENDRVFIAVSA